MAVVHKITSNFLSLHTGIVRDRESSPSQVRASLQEIGAEVGRHILVTCCTVPAVVTTPMDEPFKTLKSAELLSIVVTTKADHQIFGDAVAKTLTPSKMGYMNFEGRRGFDALNSPVRDIELPDVHGQVVNAVVAAKSCLATGCTAVSLAKTAMQEYMPKRMIFSAIFYSSQGIQELEKEFPHSDIFVVGEPDQLDDDGLLHPGVGILERRT